MRDQSRDQSDALLISLLVKDTMNSRLEPTELQQLIDKVISSVENEEVLKQHVKDPDLRLKLLDYGLWKETLGKEGHDDGPFLKLLGDNVDIVQEEGILAERVDLGQVRKQIFNQTMDLVSTILTELGLSGDEINEMRVQLATPIMEEIGKMGRDALTTMDHGLHQNFSMNFSLETGALEQQQQKRSYFDRLLDMILPEQVTIPIKEQLDKATTTPESLEKKISDLLSPILDDGAIKDQITNEVQGFLETFRGDKKTLWEISISVTAAGEDQSRVTSMTQCIKETQDMGDQVDKAGSGFLAALLGHEQWRELNKPSTAVGPHVEAIVPKSLEGMDLDLIRGLPGLGNVKCKSLQDGDLTQSPNNTPAVGNQEEIDNPNRRNGGGIGGLN